MTSDHSCQQFSAMKLSTKHKENFCRQVGDIIDFEREALHRGRIKV